MDMAATDPDVAGERHLDQASDLGSGGGHVVVTGSGEDHRADRTGKAGRQRAVGVLLGAHHEGRATERRPDVATGGMELQTEQAAVKVPERL